jgi:hypothetical protein
MLALLAGLLTTVVHAQTKLDQLAVKVERAEAIRAVKRLQHTYHAYLDNGLWSEITPLLTDNATADFAALPLPTTHLVGKSNVTAHLMQVAGRKSDGLAAGQLHTHLLMQPIIHLGSDGHTAQGTWHELAMLGQRSGEPDATTAWVGAIYENRYVEEDGVWKIAYVGRHEQYRGAYRDGGQKAPPKWEIPYHFEAAHVGLTIPQSALKSSATKATLAQWVARANRLEDETAVQNLQHMYGYYMDRKHYDDVAELFAANGTWEIGSLAPQKGPAQIRKALETTYGAPALRYGELFEHILLGTIATVAPDGKTAMARSTEIAMIGLINDFARWELGTYENRFVKEAGVWKLEAVRYFPRVVTSYEQGWGKQGLGAFSFPAFHYPNPVTQRTPRYPTGVVSVAMVPTGALRKAPIQSEDAALQAAERAVARAIGVDASENLNSAYGYYLDESAWDEVADMMSNTGVFDLSSVGVYVGRERARKALKLRYPNSGRGANFFTIHQLVQPVTHISDDGLVARSRMRLFQGGGSANGTSASWIGGTYENRAVFEDGEWKFFEKDLQHSFSATQKDGWAKVAPRRAAPANTTQATKGQPTGVAAQFPPDRPERTEQYAFPEIAEPTFHYVNPVSGRRPLILLEAK